MSSHSGPVRDRSVPNESDDDPRSPGPRTTGQRWRGLLVAVFVAWLTAGLVWLPFAALLDVVGLQPGQEGDPRVWAVFVLAFTAWCGRWGWTGRPPFIR